MTNLRSLMIATGLAFAFGCSGDDDGGSSTTQLKDLSAAELETQCRATKADFDAAARGGCILDARDTPETCDTAAAACDGVSGIDCDSIIAEDVADCTVTVGELKSCLSELGRYFAPLSCAVGPAAAPPTCMQSVAQKCTIFGG